MNNQPIIITLLGIRPDIIRMFKLIEMLDAGQDEHDYKHIFCHTGQHFDHELDGLFYEQLGVRAPDWNMHVGKTLKESGGKTGHAEQTALMFEKTAEMIEKFNPSAVIYLGDTNSVISSVVVSRFNIPVIHIEAGGRSFDWRMPEEKCRTIIDHLADAHYCYTPRHQENLLREGISEHRIKVVGNIIYDAIECFMPLARKQILAPELEQISSAPFTLVTLHREENTSNKNIFDSKINDLITLSEKTSVIFPLMPRVRANLERFGLLETLLQSKIHITKPLGYLEFLKLQERANIIITDSGTVQEEAYILGIPAIIARKSTERPETILKGASILTEGSILEAYTLALTLPKVWDRNCLNSEGGSPSERIYNDIILKFTTGYFKHSREREYLPNEQYIIEAYGE